MPYCLTSDLWTGWYTSMILSVVTSWRCGRTGPTGGTGQAVRGDIVRWVLGTLPYLYNISQPVTEISFQLQKYFQNNMNNGSLTQNDLSEYSFYSMILDCSLPPQYLLFVLNMIGKIEPLKQTLFFWSRPTSLGMILYLSIEGFLSRHCNFYVATTTSLKHGTPPALWLSEMRGGCCWSW